jgi:ribonuclease HIII
MNYVFTISDKDLKKFITYYQKIEENSDDLKIKHRFKTDDFSITVYNSNKVMFQGTRGYNEYKKWADIFGIETLPNEEELPIIDYDNQYYNLRVIGSDEVGTGDFFGPVVVCSAYVTPQDYSFLDTLNIKDSKRINDREIRVIGEKLISQISYHILVLKNEKFNELTSQGYNMNKIKAYLHNHAIKKLVDKHSDYQKIILDKFCSESNYFNYLSGETVVKNIDFLTQAESIHQAVAVAAIIARYKFLLAFDELSKEIGIVLPKGAGPGVDAIAKVIALKHGEEVFNKIAKVNFKNFEKIKKN